MMKSCDETKNYERENLAQHLIVFLMSLVAPLLLFVSRRLDDNRLTSWNWAFNDEGFLRFGLVVGFVLALAWGLSRLSFYERRKSLFLFVAAFVAAVPFWSEPDVIVDAARYFTQAKYLKVYGVDFFAEQWGKSIFAWTDLPLVPLLYGLVFKFFGEQRIFAQALNTVLYSGAVVLTYHLGKTLWSEDLGFWAGLLLLGFPYLFTQVPLFLVDVPTMFFFMLAVVSCVNSLEKGGAVRIVIAGFALFFFFYAKYSSLMMLGVIPVIYAYFLLKNPVQVMKRGGATALLATILIGGLFFYYKDIFAGQLDFLVEYQKPGLKRWSESYVSTFLFQTHPFITAAALFSFYAALRKIDFKYAIISFLFLLFVIMQVKRIRYTLPIFPMISLMAAYGMAEMRNRPLIKHVVFSVVATSLVVALTGFLPLLKSLGIQNLQAAGQYLNTAPTMNIRVFSLAGEDAVVGPDIAVPMLDIYTDKNLLYEKTPASSRVMEKAKTSPLRFTWEYPVPGYYSGEARGRGADGLVVISDRPDPILPDAIKNIASGYPSRKTFHQSSYIFQHQTFVTVYHK